MKQITSLVRWLNTGDNFTLAEDEIINNGVPGGRAAINFLRSLRDMLSGNTRSSINMTVKWDGAPAIFAGVDPEDGI